VIDEAQNLSLPALEEVRMLSNLETEKSKLIQIVLIGQSNLRDVLGRPELEQLRQRVTVRYHLQPLDAEETHAYVNHRLRRAAIGAPLEFSRDVTDLVHLHSQGLPRKINVIADAILLFGYGEERHTIDVDLTHEVLEELEATGVIAPPSADRQTQTVIPPAPATPAAMSHEIQTREAQIAQRERQLAEQQRILAEEYRLLRVHRDTPADRMSEPARSAWTPPRAPQPASAQMAMRATPVGVRQLDTVVAAPVRRAARHEPPPDKFWGRLRRGLFGEAKAVWEE
jgi:hypothetical protein